MAHVPHLAPSGSGALAAGGGPNSGFRAVTRHADVARVDRDAETFTSTKRASIPELDGVRHRALRSLLQRQFGSSVITRYTDFLRRLTATTLDAALAKSLRFRRGSLRRLPDQRPRPPSPLSRRPDPRDRHRRAELRRDDARATGATRRTGSAAGEPREAGTTAHRITGGISRSAVCPGADPTRLRADCGDDPGPCPLRPGSRRREGLAQPVGRGGHQRADHGHIASRPVACVAGRVRRTCGASQRAPRHPDHQCRTAPRSRQPAHPAGLGPCSTP